MHLKYNKILMWTICDAFTFRAYLQRIVFFDLWTDFLICAWCLFGESCIRRCNHEASKAKIKIKYSKLYRRVQTKRQIYMHYIHLRSHRWIRRKLWILLEFIVFSYYTLLWVVAPTFLVSFTDDRRRLLSGVKKRNYSRLLDDRRRLSIETLAWFGIYTKNIYTKITRFSWPNALTIYL